MNKLNDPMIRNLIVAVLAALGLFLIVEVIAVIGDIRIKGDTFPSKVITVSGTGEVYSVPNIATFSFTVTEQSKDVATAENLMSTKANKAIDFLKKQGIDQKDIKTENYYTTPHYEYSNSICTQGVCPPSKSTLTGYDVSETVSVKVRDITKAGDILSGIADLGVGETSGLSFVTDDPSALQLQAKVAAIAKAKEEATVLAQNLGARLGKAVSLSEDSGGSAPQPYAIMDKATLSSAGAVAPQLEPGQQKITATVSVTYEIK